MALSGIGVTDALPSGLAVSTPNGLTGTCGAGTITANAGDTNVSLSGANLDVSTSPNASCTFSVNVTGTVIGVQNNTTGAVTSTEGGTGGTATASVAVVVPPSNFQVVRSVAHRVEWNHKIKLHHQQCKHGSVDRRWIHGYVPRWPCGSHAEWLDGFLRWWKHYGGLGIEQRKSFWGDDRG